MEKTSYLAISQLQFTMTFGQVCVMWRRRCTVRTLCRIVFKAWSCFWMLACTATCELTSQNSVPQLRVWEWSGCIELWAFMLTGEQKWFLNLTGFVQDQMVILLQCIVVSWGLCICLCKFDKQLRKIRKLIQIDTKLSHLLTTQSCFLKYNIFVLSTIPLKKTQTKCCLHIQILIYLLPPLYPKTTKTQINDYIPLTLKHFPAAVETHQSS